MGVTLATPLTLGRQGITNPPPSPLDGAVEVEWMFLAWSVGTLCRDLTLTLHTELAGLWRPALSLTLLPDPLRGKNRRSSPAPSKN